MMAFLLSANFIVGLIVGAIVYHYYMKRMSKKMG